MGIVDFRDSRPIYEQIAAYYKRLILCGALAEDEKLPSVRELAMELSTNPNTVQKAYEVLEREGYSYTVKGRGRFVTARTQLVEAQVEEILGQILQLARDAMEMGLSRDEVLRRIAGRLEEDAGGGHLEAGRREQQ